MNEEKSRAIKWLKEFKRLAIEGSQDRWLYKGSLLNLRGDCCTYGAVLLACNFAPDTIRAVMTAADAVFSVNQELGVFPEAIFWALNLEEFSTRLPRGCIETYIMEYSDQRAATWDEMFTELERLVSLVEAL